MRIPLSIVLLPLAWLAAGCGEPEPTLLGGRAVPAETLQRGREVYERHCASCHGSDGAGDGPGSVALQPPARDLRLGIYSFTATPPGRLPNDLDLTRVLERGLRGTNMAPFRGSERELDALVQYVKTFAPLWRDPDAEVAPPVEIGRDPFDESRIAQARRLGEELYHGLTQCDGCHPAYARYERISDAALEHQGVAREGLGPSIYAAKEVDTDFGYSLRSPDFLEQAPKAGDTVEDLARTIAGGVGGVRMNPWAGALENEQLWALAHYVHGLLELRGTDQAAALRAELITQNP